MILTSYNAGERLAGREAWRAVEEHLAHLNAETLYGPIAKVLRFGELVVTYVYQFALLW